MYKFNKRGPGILLLVTAILIISAAFNHTQPKQKILIITGGHEFEREAFFNIFDNMPHIEYKEVTQPDANQLYASDVIEDFDVLVFYDMVQEINDSQKMAFIDLLQKGKGLVFLHHSLVSYQEWDEFEKIIGGRYVYSEDSSYASTYRHDVDIPVKIADKNHPVTFGIEDFDIRDEVYGNYKVIPSVNPLLTTDHQESGPIIGWTNVYGKSRIIYIQLGHDHYAYENTNFRRLIKQSINWVILNN